MVCGWKLSGPFSKCKRAKSTTTSFPSPQAVKKKSRKYRCGSHAYRTAAIVYESINCVRFACERQVSLERLHVFYTRWHFVPPYFDLIAFFFSSTSCFFSASRIMTRDILAETKAMIAHVRASRAKTSTTTSPVTTPIFMLTMCCNREEED